MPPSSRMLHQLPAKWTLHWRLMKFLSLILLLNLKLEQVSSLNSVLDLNSTFPYLINKTSGQIIEPRDYMNFDNIYTPDETYKREQTAQGHAYHLLKAFDFANYFQSDYWHYSSELELRQSALPVANESLCSQQLNWIETQLNESRLFHAGEQHMKLMSLMDSFGRPEASNYQGHNLWLGSYRQCVRSSINLQRYDLEQCRWISSTGLCKGRHGEMSQARQPIRARYCIGKARDVDWPSELMDDYVPRISYKLGLCLPESCETLSITRHKDQIQRLMLYSAPDYLKPRLRLMDMYCLPDPRSPIREFSLATRVYLSICGLWFLGLVAATCLYSCYARHQSDIKSMSEQINYNLIGDQRPQLGSSTIEAITVGRSDMSSKSQPPGALQKSLTYKTPGNPLMLKRKGSLTLEDQSVDSSRSSSSLQTSSSASSSGWLHEAPFLIRVSRAMSLVRNMAEFQRPPVLLRQPNADRNLRINLNSLDSIKCLCCVLVIFGHVVFIHMQHSGNIVQTIELSQQVYPRFLMAFFNFVDTFFIISGMLTSYFIFKRFKRETFANPLLWLQISILRLLRLSPIYIISLWFVKLVSVHLADGPLWDYGTDKNSIKGLCINDHWWKSILYLGNLGTMQPLCILPAWSIILDSQYSLILPPMIYLIFRYKRAGYLALMLAVVISTANMSLQLIEQTAVKTSDMAKVRLHVYPLISRFAAEFYNTAWNRIGPIAIGVLGGHMLYLYDMKQIRRWPWFMRGNSFKFVLMMHLFIFLLPTISRFTDMPDSTQETNMTAFVLSNATMKPIWSIINTIFLLRLVSDLRDSSVLARLASHNIWHCLGKLCFVSYLIHYEIIMLLLKSRHDGLMDPSWPNAMREFTLAFTISIILSYFVYILFEAPINNLIMLNFNKPNYQAAEDKQLDCGSDGMKKGDRQEMNESKLGPNVTADTNSACGARAKTGRDSLECP